MNKIIKFFDGKKTYFGILASVIYMCLVYTNLVPSNELVWALILSLTGVAFRDALNKK